MYMTKAVRLQMRRAHCVLASFAAWICRGRVQTVAQYPWHLGAVDSLLQRFYRCLCRAHQEHED